MSCRFLISGLLNVETTAKVRGFPIEYFPIDYPFFGIGMTASGVALNLAKALHTLGDKVSLCSMIGDDPAGGLVLEELQKTGVPIGCVEKKLPETPVSVVLYDGSGRRQIYCDLKNIQETAYDFPPDILSETDAVLACNINFSRPLLKPAKEAGKLIATDVHVLSDPDDAYNRDFLNAADILFLSDEGIHGDKREFLSALALRYPCRIIVLGMGARGALMYLRDEDRFAEQPAYPLGGVVNTIGAGDALFASFMHFYIKGYPPEKALDRARLFAAMKIRFSGASSGFPTEEEMEREEERAVSLPGSGRSG